MSPRPASSSYRRPAPSAIAGAVAVLGIVSAAASAAAQDPVAAGVTTPGRAGAALAAAVGLSSVVIGAIARRGGGNGRARTAAVAVALGLAGLVLAAQHLARFTGGFGTGDGRAGALVAIVAALAGAVLGALALARARRGA